jgi:hypothetical protein
MMLVDVSFRFLLNTCALFVLLAFIYYPRHKHREFVVSASLFNISVFCVLTILSQIEFSLAAGFGLFAILALFTLRSEPIRHTDMGYFFACVSIAVISSISLVSIYFGLAIILLLLLVAYVVDHHSIMSSKSRIVLNLDNIAPGLITDPEQFKTSIQNKLGAQIFDYRIISVCYVTEVVKVEVEI